MIISEIAQAHDGSLGMAHAYIEALATTGIDIVKFQLHIAEAESSEHEPFRIQFSQQDASRFDYWKRMEFSPEEWVGLKQHCEDLGLEFMASPFSNAAVDLLEKMGVKRYKIGSGEIDNYLMLEKIARSGKPMILSSGMSSYNELGKSIAFLKKFGNPLSILQCSSNYPSPPEQWGLNVISELHERFALPVGFSDHSGDIFACLAVAALGAEIFEFHVVFDKQQFGPDTSSSITIEQTAQLVKGIHLIQESLASPLNKTDSSAYAKIKTIFGKSLAVNRDLPAEHIIRMEDLEVKKPQGYGISARDFKQTIGKKLNKNMKQWSFLTWNDIQ